MSDELKELHDNLTKMIGRALFGYERYIKGLPPLETFDDIENAWIDSYRGEWNISTPSTYPMFRNTVNGLVGALIVEFDMVNKGDKQQ